MKRTMHLMKRTMHLMKRTMHQMKRTMHLMKRTMHLMKRTMHLPQVRTEVVVRGLVRVSLLPIVDGVEVVRVEHHAPEGWMGQEGVVARPAGRRGGTWGAMALLFISQTGAQWCLL